MAEVVCVHDDCCRVCWFGVVDFFEECIEEERFAAEKLQVMKEAIHAKTEYKKSVETGPYNSPSPPPVAENSQKSSNGIDKTQLENEH